MQTESNEAPQQEAPQQTDERSALIEGLQALATEPEAEAPAEEASEEATEEAPEEADETEEKAEEADEDSDDESEPEAEPEPENPKLKQAREAERAQRQRLERERAEFRQEQERFQQLQQEWQPKIQQFEQMAKRAEYDPVSVFEALGVDVTKHGDVLAKHLYAASEKAKDDPRIRDESAHTMQMREMRKLIEETQRTNQELVQQIQQQQQAQADQQKVEAFLSATEKAVNENAPLMSKRMARDKDGARQVLAQAAEYLLDYTGEVPDHADVVARAEEMLREQVSWAIEDGGPTKTKSSQPAETRKAAKSLSNEQAPATKPRPSAPMTPEEERAMLIAKLQSGDID